MSGMAIWITGLPGSGKSTAADAVKEIYPEFIILRMDEMRKIVTPAPTYSDSERDIVYRAMVYLAMTLTGLGHDVIIDATGNRRKWRKLARRLIPRYAEVYLGCPIDICMDRERKRTDTREAPRDIYQKGAAGRPVPGLTVPYEEPLNPEIAVNTDKNSLREIIAKIEKIISGLKQV
jgi:adenylylsulfate kinase